MIELKVEASAVNVIKIETKGTEEMKSGLLDILRLQVLPVPLILIFLNHVPQVENAVNTVVMVEKSALKKGKLDV